MKKRKNKVLVAFSGGVDSSVAAEILKRDGFDVAGAFMILSDNLKESKKRAQEIAKSMAIPLYLFDFKKEFKQKIISEFISSYDKGKTPNPCVDCNREIKFNLFLKKALGLGFDYIATGHYARIKDGGIFKAADKEKDQSYFLWRMRRSQIKKIIMPLGEYHKREVRKMAKKFKLPNHNSPESQEICFVGDDLNLFLKERIKNKEGLIKDPEGKILGKHSALFLYTIGQRKGLNLPGGPYFVISKDTKKNTLIVSKNEKDLFKKELYLKKINWICKEEELPTRVSVKIRYRQKSFTGKLIKDKLVFDKPQKAITPGQSAVFYRGEELLGGGIIR